MRNILFIIALSLGTGMVACSNHTPGIPPHGEVGVAMPPISISGNGINAAGVTAPVSGGPNLKGVVVPTATGIVGRLQVGIGVSSTTGNFQRALTQVRTNLPSATDVNKVSGFDQAQLLVFAACSDLTTGTNPLMRTRYNVNPTATVATNQAALIAAGMTMLDSHTAKLASEGPAVAQLNTIFTNLVQTQTANTSTVAFMTVCIAANSAGSFMLGI